MPQYLVTVSDSKQEDQRLRSADLFELVMQNKCWDFTDSAAQLKELKRGDVLVFYLNSRSAHYIAGEASVVGKPKALKSKTQATSKSKSPCLSWRVPLAKPISFEPHKVGLDAVRELSLVKNNNVKRQQLSALLRRACRPLTDSDLAKIRNFAKYGVPIDIELLKFGDRFTLPEYHRASGSFFKKFGQLCLRASSPLLSQIRSEEVDELPSHQIVGPAQERIPSQFDISWDIEFSGDAVRAGDYQVLADQIVDQAGTIAEHMEADLLRMLSQVCQAAGQVADMKINLEEGLTNDQVIEMLDKFPLTFDEDGQLKERTIVVSPQLMEAIKNLPPMTEEQKLKSVEKLRVKHEEWLSGRRSRRLS